MKWHTPEPIIGAWGRGPEEFTRQENSDLQVLDDCVRFCRLQVPEGDPSFRHAPHRRRVAAHLLGQD